ncbi:MAG TPA: radical SAM protein [Streptosporangiaceae bacterium]|nr:radical SAM protein [Streptosporangiaceae bacterium]
MTNLSWPVNSRNVERLHKAIATGAVKGDFLPAVYVVEPTSRCNLACVMCPNSRLPDSKLGDATLEELASTFAVIAPYAELVMLYFMGESTLHPEFVRLLDSARASIAGRIALSTNANRMTDVQIDSILSNVDLLILPIDRWNPTMYERIRRGSKFEDVVANAEELLRRRGGSPSPTIVVKGLDIDLPLRPEESVVGNEALNFASYWTDRGAVPLSGWLNTWAGQMPNLLKLASRPNPYEGSTRVPCADLWFKMVINWQSQVVLCCHNWDYSVPLGRLGERGLLDVWHSDYIASLRASHVGGKYDCTTLCRTCREWGEPSELDAYLRLNTDDLFQVF